MDTLLPRAASPSVSDRLLKAKQAHDYVRDFWFLITAVVGLLTIINFSSKLARALHKPKKTGPADRNAEPPVSGQTGRFSIRRLPTAFADTFRVYVFRLTLPLGGSAVINVAELAFILSYIASLLIFCWINTREMNIFFFEDRAAHLGSSQVALIVALAGKNNIISFLTGVGHEKLNILHRAAARACLVLYWIHALVRGISGLPQKFDFTHDWMRWGAASLVAFSLATILSFRPIRTAAYEFFLISHIILIAIFLVGGYLHTYDPGFSEYFWPALMVWGLDRFLRFARLIWNNRAWRAIYGPTGSTGTVELLSRDTVRLTLRRHMKWQPGQHAYVILPSVSNLPTEAHPFTIASIPHSVDGADDNGEKDVMFIIRGRNGFTKRLRDHASEKKGQVSAYIDGPYGSPPNLRTFSSCVLISGGSGVSYTLPLLLDLIHQARQGTSSVQRILFIWTIRDPSHIEWISKTLTGALAATPSSLQVDCRIHVTNPNATLSEYKYLEFEASTPPSPTTPLDEKKVMQSITHVDVSTSFIRMKTKQGRPDIPRLLKDTINTSDGPVSVDVSGPAALAQTVRAALSSDITDTASALKGRAPVTLHVETFGM